MAADVDERRRGGMSGQDRLADRVTGPSWNVPSVNPVSALDPLLPVPYEHLNDDPEQLPLQHVLQSPFKTGKSDVTQQVRPWQIELESQSLLVRHLPPGELMAQLNCPPQTVRPEAALPLQH